LVALLVVALIGLVMFFGLQGYRAWELLRRPTVVRVADTSGIRPWMTVRFIARAHRVPVADLATQLGGPADGSLTLRALAASQGVPEPELENKVRQAVAQLQATTSTPGPGT
jgi:hypothetical protein